MLVYQKEVAFEVDEDESVLEVAQDVADWKRSPMENGVTCLLVYCLELVLVILAPWVLRHVLGKLVALCPRLHSDKNYSRDELREAL